MSTKPYINAGAAALYIITLVSLFHILSQTTQENSSLIAPVAFLSVFVLSAAFMGYAFVYQPLLLVLEGKKQEGVTLFLQTLGIFALFTAVAVVAFVFLNKKSSGVDVPDPNDIVCTSDAKQCPDGSFVGRVGPRCEFAQCTGE
jgi:hypothetical protein